MEKKNTKIKKVLVTGGAGYIGSVVSKKLLQNGYQVRVLDKLIFGRKPLGDIKNKIEIATDDIRKVNPSVLNDIDAVIHLAGFSTEPTSQYNPRVTDLINHISTERLALLAKAKGIKRFIFASSCSIYFTLSTPLNPPLYKETDPVNPISCYSLTKRCAEQSLLDMADSNFQPVIFRKGTLFGFSPRMRYDLVFNSFVKDAYFKKVLTVDAGGDIWRPIIDIQDAADAYIESLNLPLQKVGRKIFNVADQNCSIGQLANTIKRILKNKRNIDIQLDIKPYGITRNYKADVTLFKKTFNFRSSRPLEKALFEIWQQFEKDNNYNPADPIYYNDLWYRSFYETKEGAKFKKIS